MTPNLDRGDKHGKALNSADILCTQDISWLRHGGRGAINTIFGAFSRLDKEWQPGYLE